MGDRVKSIFAKAQDFAHAIIPFPSHQAKFCAEADRLNALRGRVFGHTSHSKGVVCWAKAAETELSDQEILGISFHEIGHIIAEEMGTLPGHNLDQSGDETPQATQDEADEIVRQILKVPLYYNKKTLQEVSPGVAFSVLGEID